MLQCPVCKEALVYGDRKWVCNNKHSFDVSKHGAVNLLQSQKSKLRNHGDNKLMVEARTRFLSAGHYITLRNVIASMIPSDATTGLDCGCGEGWYTQGIYQSTKLKITGVDVSKYAIDTCAKVFKEALWVVGSSFALPIMAECIDVAWSVFAPFDKREIARVLKSGGTFIHVYPLENHLIELKQNLYDDVYLNQVPELIDILELVDTTKIKEGITLSGSQEIMDLLMMTPYGYRTHPDKIHELQSLELLDVTLEFGVRVYKKGEQNA